jgi:hypothetical protein
MENPWKCEKCPTLSRSKKALRYHMSNVHPKVLFQCDLCARFIKEKRTFRIHMRIHIQRVPKE